MNYLWHILVMLNLYILWALSLNLLSGYTGLISLSQSAFGALGAYTAALCLLQGWGFVPSLGAAVLITGLVSLGLALPALRLRGDFFVLATLGFQIIAFAFLNNCVDITQGPFGITGIPSPQLLGWEVNSVFQYFLFSSGFTLVCALLLWGITKSPFGRVLKAIREDEVSVTALGKNVFKFKVQAFVLAGAFAAIPGALFAGYMRYIDPTSFTLNDSIFILSIVVIGGAGNFHGPVLGAVLMVLLPEFLRSLRLPDEVAANARQILYGFLLIILMRLRPQGLWGDYRFK